MGITSQGSECVRISKLNNKKKKYMPVEPNFSRALNSLFQQWDAQPPAGLWNISGEPCTGTSINTTELEDPINNPSIKCDCNFENGTTCHIIQMRVYGQNTRGVIPEVLTAFTYLEFLKIDQNSHRGPLPAFIGNLTTLKLL
ncbi:unnamed protein product [Ilex paraguariensis]|uniref:LRR receptor-like serine/threonine-protein kinase n=1 Tax=Ilex paraguariensis TaxID=185542 RepID=A0ABC8TH27_9AQUA